MKIFFLFLTCVILICPLQMMSQSEFGYKHWSDGEYKAEVVKDFSGGELPKINFIHYRLGKEISHSEFIDYKSNVDAPHRAIIRYRILRDQVQFDFKHCQEKDLNDCIESNHMNIKDVHGAMFKIEIPYCTVENLKNRNDKITLKITYLGGGNPPPPQSEPDKTICPGQNPPKNWVIIRREACIACPGGSTCRQSVIRDLNHRPSGFEVKICPGSVIPNDFQQVGTEPCGGQCADPPSSACVMRIRKR